MRPRVTAFRAAEGSVIDNDKKYVRIIYSVSELINYIDNRKKSIRRSEISQLSSVAQEQSDDAKRWDFWRNLAPKEIGESEKSAWKAVYDALLNIYQSEFKRRRDLLPKARGRESEAKKNLSTAKEKISNISKEQHNFPASILKARAQAKALESAKEHVKEMESKFLASKRDVMQVSTADIIEKISDLNNNIVLHCRNFIETEKRHYENVCKVRKNDLERLSLCNAALNHLSVVESLVKAIPSKWHDQEIMLIVGESGEADVDRLKQYITTMMSL